MESGLSYVRDAKLSFTFKARSQIASNSTQKLRNKEASKRYGYWLHSFCCLFSIEEVAEAAPRATKWFQLYIYKDRKVTANLVHRAQRSGFKAIVLTVDAPYFGRRLADVRNRFKLPPHLRMANFVGLGEAETQ